MDGKQYFIKCCNERSIDAAKYFQIGLNKRKLSSRLEHHFNYLTRKETQLFAVTFFKNHNIYVAWSLREKKAVKKSVFSVKYSDIDFPIGNKILSVKKAIEYLGWGEETIFAFAPEQVNEFLSKNHLGECKYE